MPRITDELELTGQDFTNFRKLVREKCGIHLHEGKKELVRSRIGKRLRETKFKSFRQYYRYLVQEDKGPELALMLNAISTNLTSFFRETNHFDYLSTEILPVWRNMHPPQPLNIWSAGCSSGEEPYSLAICLQEHLAPVSLVKAKILATDISTEVLSTAISGVYPESRVQTIPFEVLRKYFRKGHGKWDGYYRLKPEIRDMIEFKRLNLMGAFGFDKHFDVIFCRNVMIYFDSKAQGSLINKFHDCLNPGGYLFIGHSESLLSIPHRFKYVMPAVYMKP